MSFLAPWFVLAGLAAVSLPVLFHLFRRTPRGKMPFSTLMFLTPSPPRLTSRNRLENWPLLLMRAAVLVLLALAFGRPFLRQLLEDQTNSPLGKRAVMVIDTSASMRRGDLWSQAQRETTARIEQIGPHDELAIMAFDHQPHSLLSFETWRAAPVAERSGLARAVLAELKPSWSDTRLDQALLAAVETLEAAEQEKAAKSIDREQRIVLISDLQAGSRVAALQSFEWPKRVPVELVAVATKESNAGVHPLETTDDNTRTNAALQRLRVLVTNSPGASRETFELEWKSAANEEVRGVQVYVPPGQTRVASTPPMPEGQVAQLVLQGDAEPFDNTLWFVPPTREQVRVLHLSAEQADDPQSLRYFLERALSLPAAGRVVTVDTIDPYAESVRPPTAFDLDNVPLVVLGLDRELPEAWQAPLATWLDRGGVLMAVIANTNSNAWRSFLPDELSDTAAITIAENDANREYSLLSEIDLRHPLFAPLNDPRFSDFTKIRFWKHRRVTLSESAANSLTVVAKFDSGDPALIEIKRGRGRLFLLASGWQPRESQLGVSSKFVPLMATLVDLGWRRSPATATYQAGETIDLTRLGNSQDQPLIDSENTSPRANGPWIIKTPTGEQLQIVADAPQYQPTAGPGVYEVESAAGLQRIAINVPADESKTEPLAPEAFESLGVRLWKPITEPTPATVAEKQLLQVRELESRQQLWRWCLVLALVAIIGETWYAGQVARQTAAVTM